MNYSYWEYDSFGKSVDVAIIGSGIVGLSAAISLKNLNPSLKITVIEKGPISGGASLRNAGFACFGSPTELLDDLKQRPAEEVFNLVEKRFKGLQRLRSILGDDAIEYEELGGYEVFDDELSFAESIEAMDSFNKALQEITSKKETYKLADYKIATFGFRGVRHMIENCCEGQINTGKMMKAFIKKAQENDITIINGVEVKDFKEEGDSVVICTSWQTLKTKRLLLATNGYTSLLVKDLDVKPGRAQVLITEPIKGLKMKGTFHYDKGYYYFRNVGERLLIGGGRNLDFEGETTTEIEITKNIQDAIEKLVSEKILPGQSYKIEHRWSGLLGLGTNTKSPIVKAISPNVYCAVRLGGMGVALGSLVGQEAAGILNNGLHN
jgi:gamma-glutamylputrescine oxidase